MDKSRVCTGGSIINRFDYRVEMLLLSKWSRRQQGKALETRMESQAWLASAWLRFRCCSSFPARDIGGQAVKEVGAADNELVAELSGWHLATVDHALGCTLADAKHLGDLVHGIERFSFDPHAHLPILGIRPLATARRSCN